MRDFLSDMLTRIRNGQRAGLNVIYLNSYMPRICFDILEILQDEGYIRGFSEYSDSKTNEKKLKVFLKYGSGGSPVITGIFRVSTPGRRIYLSTKVL
jgi:small subunit ribosomal protein S8